VLAKERRFQDEAEEGEGRRASLMALSAWAGVSKIVAAARTNGKEISYAILHNQLKDRNNQNTHPCLQRPSLATLARCVVGMGGCLENCCSSAD